MDYPFLLESCLDDDKQRVLCAGIPHGRERRFINTPSQWVVRRATQCTYCFDIEGRQARASQASQIKSSQAKLSEPGQASQAKQAKPAKPIQPSHDKSSLFFDKDTGLVFYPVCYMFRSCVLGLGRFLCEFVTGVVVNCTLTTS